MLLWWPFHLQKLSYLGRLFQECKQITISSVIKSSKLSFRKFWYQIIIFAFAKIQAWSLPKTIRPLLWIFLGTYSQPTSQIDKELFLKKLTDDRIIWIHYQIWQIVDLPKDESMVWLCEDCKEKAALLNSVSIASSTASLLKEDLAPSQSATRWDLILSSRLAIAIFWYPFFAPYDF